MTQPIDDGLADVQIQTNSRVWVTDSRVVNNLQRISFELRSIQSRYPDRRVRAVDTNGRLIDLLTAPERRDFALRSLIESTSTSAPPGHRGKLSANLRPLAYCAYERKDCGPLRNRRYGLQAGSRVATRKRTLGLRAPYLIAVQW
jgi:hypothetical protein